MVVGVILARAGSKRVPGKNKRLLAGYPLVVWTLETARESQIDRIVTSTDDSEILDLAEAYGFAVQRPADLAQDDSPDAPAIRHALEAIQPSGYGAEDLVLHLRPTAPFRTPEEINKVVELLRRFPCDSVVSVKPASHHPHKMYLETGDVIGIWPEVVPAAGSSALGEASQVLPGAWAAAGFIDGAKIGQFLSEGRMDCGVIVGWPVKEDRALDLDTEEDIIRANALALAKGWKPGHLG